MNYFGTSGDDRLVGSTGDDYIWGGAGDDMLWGKGGVDELRPGLGNDTVGGTGTDTVSYLALAGDYSPGITVDLSSKVTQDGDQVSLVYEGPYIDTLKDIENVTGSASADTITGDSGNNVIEGYGDDDTLDGGGGTDTAVFKGNRANYMVVLEGSTVTVTDNRTLQQRQNDDVHYYADEGTDTLTNFELYEFDGVTYTLDELLPDDYADFVGDAADPYGSVPVGGSATGEVEETGDTDLFAVTLTEGVQYIFNLEGSDTGGGTLSDPVMRLLDSTGAELAYDDESGVGHNSLLAYVATASGTYYVEAAAYAGASTGTYTLYAETGGTPNDDNLTGDDGPDAYAGLDGDDVISGGGGDDTLSGGRDDDEIYGNVGFDVLYGGPGDDSLHGGQGNDTLNGGNGQDTLQGGKGDDWVNGNGGRDRISGNGGNDTLMGSFGSDTVNGGGGADHVYGDGGSDRLNGNDGQDTVYAGNGNDTVTGGAGADIFVFDGNDGDNIITDFQNGIDKIEITSGAGGFGGLAVTDTGDDVEIAWNNSTVLIENVNLGAIGGGDFLFT